MLSRRLAKLLFRIALVAQIAASVTGAGPMAGERGGGRRLFGPPFVS